MMWFVLQIIEPPQSRLFNSRLSWVVATTFSYAERGQAVSLAFSFWLRFNFLKRFKLFKSSVGIIFPMVIIG